MKKRIFSLALAAAMVLSLMTGFAGSAEEETGIIGSGAVTYDPSVPVNDGEDITISFWYPDPGVGGYARWQGAMDDYSKIHPNVTFEVDSSLGWGDYWSKLPVAVSSGTGPDLMHFHLANFQTFIPDLAEPFPDDLAEAVKEDFNGVEPMMYEDKVYTIPVGDSTGLIVYNKDMWEEAGLTDADIPKTWDELREVAKKLTKTDGDTITVNGFDIGESVFMLALNYQKGYNIFKEDGKNTQMNNPGAIEAAKMLQGFITTDKIFAPGSGAANERFGNQQSAMLYSWTWIGDWLNANVGDSFEWDCFPTPTFEDTKVVDRNNPEVSAVVNAKSDDAHKAVAMDFLKYYFASDNYLVEMANLTYTYPTKKSCQDDPSLAENKVLATIGQYTDKTVWTGIWTSGFDNAVGTYLSDGLLLGMQDPEEALSAFDEENARLAPDATVATVERMSPLAEYLQ